MANYETLKTYIRNYIYSNETEAITGDILQGVLVEMIDESVKKGYMWGGMVTPSSTIASSDAPMFYLAFEAGTYQVGGLSLAAGEFGVIYYDTTFHSAKFQFSTVLNNYYTKTEVDTALAGKYTKPSGGIPKTDLASGVQTSLGKADTALQSVPNTYRTAAAQDVIDNGKQATLVSGTNIKTINGQSVLGSGNLDVGSDIEVKQTTGQSTTAVMSQKAVTDELDELRADLDAIDVDNIGDARAKSIDLDELPKVCGYQMFIFGTAVPTVTPDFIGQFFIDTTNQKVYCATGVANASSFKALN